MLSESMRRSEVTRAGAVSRALPATSPSSSPDRLEHLQHALSALRTLAEQVVSDPAGVRAEACRALAEVESALDDFQAEIEHELEVRHPVRSPFYRLLREHVRSCSARQRADVVHLRKQAARPEASLTSALRAATTLALVMRVELVDLVHDVHR